jgi:hypothetical protein
MGRRDHRTGSVVTRRALIGAGLLIIVFALVGGLRDPDVRPFGTILFLAAALVLHDGIWMPAMLAVGGLITRFVPEPHRPRARIAAVTAAAVTVVALPLVLGFGRAADNPSILPLHYGRGLVVILLAIALVTLTVSKARKKTARPEYAGTAPEDE